MLAVWLSWWLSSRIDVLRSLCKKLGHAKPSKSWTNWSEHLSPRAAIAGHSKTCLWRQVFILKYSVVYTLTGSHVTNGILIHRCLVLVYTSSPIFPIPSRTPSFMNLVFLGPIKIWCLSYICFIKFSLNIMILNFAHMLYTCIHGMISFYAELQYNQYYHISVFNSRGKTKLFFVSTQEFLILLLWQTFQI